MLLKDKYPPSSNTGVLKPLFNTLNYSIPLLNSADIDTFQKNTQKAKDVVIDWLQFTIKSRSVYQVLKDFGIDPEQVQHIKAGLYGYTDTFIYKEKIKFQFNMKDLKHWDLYYDRINYLDSLPELENKTVTPEFKKMITNAYETEIKKLENNLKNSMGTHIILSGYACREIEQLYTWDSILKYAYWHSSKISRIDIAIDVFDKNQLDMSKIRNYLVNGLVVSKARKALEINTREIDTGNIDGQTISFGARSSNSQVVFYDKLQERNHADYKINSDIKHWNRCEIRLKDTLAKNFLNQAIKDVDQIPYLIMEVLYNLVDFKSPADKTKRKTRKKTVQWYQDFIETTKKMKLSDKAYQTTIQQKKSWVEKSVTKTLAQVLLSDNDIDTIFSTDIQSYILTGLEKLETMDLEQINQHRIKNGTTVLKQTDIKIIKDRITKYLERQNNEN